MIFSPINLSEELAAISRKHPNNLLDEAGALLSHDANADSKILLHFPNISAIGNSKKNNATLALNKVYSIKQIKTLCINFRLRFLKSELYKGNLPYEAITAIKKFEAGFSPIKAEYFIVAPAEFFKLKDRFADPLLFAQLGNGQYYLLHQWGADFKPYTPILKYPMRNFKSVGISAIATGITFTLLLFVTGAISYPHIGMAWFYATCTAVISSMFIFISALIYGLVSFNDLSEETWNSKYFN